MNLDLFKKIFGTKLVEDAIKELNVIKDEWNQRWIKNFEDHKKIAEVLQEILKKLEKK